MADLQVTGYEKFDAVARALKQAGDKELRKELSAGLNRATKTIRADAKQSAEDKLPRRGGLNKRVARARLSTKRSGGRDPGVRIVAKGLEQLGLIDERGLVRHPVYGNRGRWVTQDVKEAQGWFTDPMNAGADEARRALVKSLDEIARKLARKY